ncbi:flagellar hook-length control protein FliK [Bacillus sporothermodurans]|uniref:flagellar hook-length control protein FliK n=1 Tax=Heyndrickxia sporothermodurans TaxID=46224 RepID=UPI00192B1F8D|nr:flagellar hook-length control protein FliK [Heyndrickxia sporothermodurans]MBL5778006.1 flagellar hook-length control protein FliK [Heyndrickxia sporothermodurans]
MNIGVLQMPVQVPFQQKLGQIGQAQQSKGFKNAFDMMVSPQNGMNSDGEQNLLEALNEVLTLLKNGFMKDDNSTGLLLNETKPTEDQISEVLGLPKEKWQEQLSTLIDELLSLIGNNPIQSTQLLSIKKSMQDGEYIKGVADLLTVLSNLPKETFKHLNPDFLHIAAKTGGVIESLAKQMDLSKNDLKNVSVLKESMQTVISKLETILEKDSNENKNTILQNTFQRVFVDKQEAIKNSTNSNSKTEISEQSLSSHVPMQQISKIEQFAIHVNRDSKPVDYQQFVKDFSNIIGKSQLLKGDGTNKLLIKLYPENLGSLRIEILQDKGMITAKLFASTGSAKELLDSQLHQLKNAFTLQNIQVDKIDVLYGEAEAQRFERGGNESGKHPFEQEQQTQTSEHEDENNVQFSDFLQESLLEEKI